MENLRLIEIHRRRIAGLMSLLILLFVTFGTLIYQFVSFNYKIERLEGELFVQAERLISIALSYEDPLNTNDAERDQRFYDAYQEGALIKWWNTDINFIENDVFEEIDPQSLPEAEYVLFDRIIAYKASTINEWELFEVIVVRTYANLLDYVLRALIILLFVIPITYYVFVYLFYRFAWVIYSPLVDVILNLEWFAGNINHEFKTSLAEIISSLDLAKITWEYEEANLYSSNSAKRLNSVLDSLGQIIHFVNSDYRKEKTNLTIAFQDCINDFQSLLQEKDIRVVKKYNEKKPIFKYIDKSPLILCFLNIFKNAIKYSHEWWVIEINVSHNYFSIKDYGIGIEKKNLDKIYDRYFRENYIQSWDGIGLSIIKRITEIYNWEVKMESEKNKFTKVTIFF